MRASVRLADVTAAEATSRTRPPREYARLALGDAPPTSSREGRDARLDRREVAAERRGRAVAGPVPGSRRADAARPLAGLEVAVAVAAVDGLDGAVAGARPTTPGPAARSRRRARSPGRSGRRCRARRRRRCWPATRTVNVPGAGREEDVLEVVAGSAAAVVDIPPAKTLPRKTPVLTTVRSRSLTNDRPRQGPADPSRPASP